MKKILTLAMALILALSLTACGGSDAPALPDSDRAEANPEIENKVELSLDKSTYEIGESIAVTLDFGQLDQDTAIIAVVKSDRPHNEAIHYEDDTTWAEYRWLGDFSEVPFYLYPQNATDGLYDVRVYADTGSGEELASITVAIGNASLPIGGEAADNGESPSDDIADNAVGDMDGNAGENTAAPSLSWPSADFITSGMEYAGGGEITYVDYIDGATQEGGMSQYSVYINAATLDDAQAYIDTLKADGFSYYSTGGENEPEPSFEFGYYQWKGEADGGNRFIMIYVGEEADTYGSSNAEYTMSIQMMDQNLYK